MKKLFDRLNNENGTALVLALLVMMVLTIMALTSTMVIKNGLTITGNYKGEQQRLHMADAGVEYAYSLIERVFANGGELSQIDLGNNNVRLDVSDSDGNNIIDLVEEINGYLVNDPDRYSDTPPNAQLTIFTDTLNIDVDYKKTTRLPGASSEFSSRYEGIGAGSSGGLALYYKMESNNLKSASKETTLRASYKCIEGGGRCL